MTFKQLLISIFTSLLISSFVFVIGISLYHNFFYTPVPTIVDTGAAPREGHIAPARQADDRVDYACSGEVQVCEDGFKQQCIYVTCACEDGFKPHGEVDGCVHQSVQKPDYKRADDDLALTEKGLQYAFAGECAQICAQVGH